MFNFVAHTKTINTMPWFLIGVGGSLAGNSYVVRGVDIKMYDNSKECCGGQAQYLHKWML